MADWPGTRIATTSLFSFGGPGSGIALPCSGTGRVWPAANRAIYMPVVVSIPVVVTNLSVIVAVQSGNMDVGIYSETGTRIVSAGSTAVGAAGLQVFNIADTTLVPGVYFLAMCVDNTTASVSTTNASAYSAVVLRTAGCQQQAVGAVTLPSTATFANPEGTYAPLVMGSTMSAVV